MNLKILAMLLLYYTLFSGFFIFGADSFNDGSGYNSTITLNETDMSTGEIDEGGLFSSGISFGRFVAFVGFGVGLPSNTPVWFMVLFGLWQTMFTIFSIGFVISSIWDG